MSVILLGVSHKSAPAALLESLAALDPRRVLSGLRESGSGEAVVLST